MMKLSKNNIKVLYLYVSTLMSSLLGFVVSIVNTNFLTEVEYGDVRYVQNFITLFAWVLFVGYYFSGRRLLSLSYDEERSRKIRGAMMIILFVCMALLSVSTVIIGFFHWNNTSLFHLFLLSSLVCFQPLLTSYVNVATQGDNHMGKLALSRVLPPTLYIVLAYFIYSSYGASSNLVMCLQWGIYSLSLMSIVLSTPHSFNGLKTLWSEIKKDNSDFGIHLYYASLAMVATNYIAGVTIGFFNDDYVGVGFYTLALTLTTPLSYLPAIVGATYFKQFVNEPRIPRKVFAGTLLVTLLSFLCFIVLVRFVVDWFYPDSYAVVSVYATYLALAFCIHGLGDMINHFLSSHGEGVAIRNSSYVCGAFKVFGFVFLVWIWDIEGALITNVVSSFLYCAVLYYYYKKNIA